MFCRAKNETTSMIVEFRYPQPSLNFFNTTVTETLNCSRLVNLPKHAFNCFKWLLEEVPILRPLINPVQNMRQIF